MMRKRPLTFFHLSDNSSLTWSRCMNFLIFLVFLIFSPFQALKSPFTPDKPLCGRYVINIIHNLFKSIESESIPQSEFDYQNVDIICVLEAKRLLNCKRANILLKSCNSVSLFFLARIFHASGFISS